MSSRLDKENRDYEINRLQQKLDLAIETLEFYGEHGSWGKINQYSLIKISHCDTEPVGVIQNRGVYMKNVDIGGKRARQALKEIKENNES